MTTMIQSSVTLSKNTNQALGIGRFAVDFMSGTIGAPSQAVLDRTALFFTDAVLCGLSAIAVKTNAPTVLRNEALSFPTDRGATVFGSNRSVFLKRPFLQTVLRFVSGIQTEQTLGTTPSLVTPQESLGTTTSMQFQ